MQRLKDFKASDLFVKALEDEGVEYIFGVPGEENLDLLESLRTSSIRQSKHGRFQIVDVVQMLRPIRRVR